MDLQPPPGKWLSKRERRPLQQLQLAPSNYVSPRDGESYVSFLYVLCLSNSLVNLIFRMPEFDSLGERFTARFADNMTF